MRPRVKHALSFIDKHTLISITCTRRGGPGLIFLIKINISYDKRSKCLAVHVKVAHGDLRR